MMIQRCNVRISKPDEHLDVREGGRTEITLTFLVLVIRWTVVTVTLVGNTAGAVD